VDTLAAPIASKPPLLKPHSTTTLLTPLSHTPVFSLSPTQAIATAKSVTDKPSLIKVSTLIGYGSPNKADTHDVHGAPLGPEETAATRENLKWPYGEFEVPKEVSLL
jgi:hypothetical protein